MTTTAHCPPVIHVRCPFTRNTITLTPLHDEIVLHEGGGIAPGEVTRSAGLAWAIRDVLGR